MWFSLFFFFLAFSHLQRAIFELDCAVAIGFTRWGRKRMAGMVLSFRGEWRSVSRAVRRMGLAPSKRLVMNYSDAGYLKGYIFVLFWIPWIGGTQLAAETGWPLRIYDDWRCVHGLIYLVWVHIDAYLVWFGFCNELWQPWPKMNEFIETWAKRKKGEE